VIGVSVVPTTSHRQNGNAARDAARTGEYVRKKGFTP
jgi:hypothetical protein